MNVIIVIFGYHFVMSELRKIEALEDFKRSSKSKTKQIKHRFHTTKREVFLTDTQTSDYTKSSGQMRILKIEHLELALRDLQKQNEQLKQTIISMKANQFFQLNQQKLKSLIRQNQRLKQQQIDLKNQLEQSLIERDFLKRFNKNLKIECETLTKQILSLKNQFGITEIKKVQKSTLYQSSSQEMKKSIRRSTSSEVLIGRKKNQQVMIDKKQKQSVINSSTSIRPISRNNEQPLNIDYFHGSFNIERKNK